jgi:serine/threonine protein kinase
VVGDELYDYLIKNGRLTVPKAKKIFTQLVGAVSYVHLNNCVHRDLKLENIMLDKNEDVRFTFRCTGSCAYSGYRQLTCGVCITQVKLCDFGFTREYERNKLLQTFCGTVCYSAPEMLKGERYMAHGTGVQFHSCLFSFLFCSFRLLHGGILVVLASFFRCRTLANGCG